MDFILNNWRLIVILAAIVVDVVVVIVFKKRPQIVDNSFLRELLFWIEEAEEKFKNGQDKKDYVLDQAKKYLGDKFVAKDVSALLEWLLSLPQKKEK